MSYNLTEKDRKWEITLKAKVIDLLSEQHAALTIKVYLIYKENISFKLQNNLINSITNYSLSSLLGSDKLAHYLKSQNGFRFLPVTVNLFIYIYCEQS